MKKNFAFFKVLLLLLIFFAGSINPALGVPWIGNIIGGDGSEPMDFLNYWDQVTPEDAGKWGEVEVSQDVYILEPLQNIYNYAKDNGLYFKGHCLIWGQQQPTWIDGLSDEEIRPKAKLCRVGASSRTKSENERHQPQIDMALHEDQELLNQEEQKHPLIKQLL